MKIVHYCSGLILSLFVGIHLLNHVMILHSESLHLGFMKTARKIYRQPFVEALIAAAVVVQVISGIALATGRWNKMADIFDRIQIASGLYLALFLIIHVAAVAAGRYKLHIDTNLYYGAGVMNMWPQKLFFIPYYFLAMSSFFFHVACIHRQKMSDYISHASAEMQSKLIMLAGLLITIAVIFRMSNLKSPARSFPVRENNANTRIISDHQKKIL